VLWWTAEEAASRVSGWWLIEKIGLKRGMQKCNSKFKIDWRRRVVVCSLLFVLFDAGDLESRQFSWREARARCPYVFQKAKANLTRECK
jgi:hypothetical protein